MSADTEPYRIQLPNVAATSIISSLNGLMIEPDGFLALTRIHRYTTRIVIQQADIFDSVLLSQQRKRMNRIINQRYKVGSEVALYEALKMIRVNLLVCENSSPALLKYLSRNTQQLLLRNEVVIPVAIVLQEQLLLYPNCIGNLSINQLSRYEAVANYLTATLIDSPLL